MGSFISPGQAQFTTDTLNDQFGPQNIAATFATVENLRKTHPNLLNPILNPGPRKKRKQTLRFAAFQINDNLVFDPALYPAPHFNKWLKWLSWLQGQGTGTFTLDGAAFQGTGGELVVKVLAGALPPGGVPSPVRFSFTHDSNISHLRVDGSTSPTFQVDVTSPDHSEINGKDEDDI